MMDDLYVACCSRVSGVVRLLGKMASGILMGKHISEGKAYDHPFIFTAFSRAWDLSALRNSSVVVRVSSDQFMRRLISLRRVSLKKENNSLGVLRARVWMFLVSSSLIPWLGAKRQTEFERRRTIGQ